MLINSLSSSPIQPLHTSLLLGLRSWNFSFFLGQKPWAVISLVSTYIWGKKGWEFFLSQSINGAFKTFLPGQSWHVLAGPYEEAGTANAVLCTFWFSNRDISVQHLSHTIKFTYQSKCPCRMCTQHLCCTGKLRLYNHPRHCSFTFLFVKFCQFPFSSSPQFIVEALVGALQSTHFWYLKIWFWLAKHVK